ncbi:MAG: hypothetical protein ACKO6N_13870 [Myxococcota bacterium]
MWSRERRSSSAVGGDRHEPIRHVNRRLPAVSLALLLSLPASEHGDAYASSEHDAAGHGAAGHEAGAHAAPASGGSSHGSKKAPAKSKGHKAPDPKKAEGDPNAPMPLPPPEPVSAEQILEVNLLEPTTGPLQQGSIASFRYELKNSSQDVVVLKELRTELAEDPPLSFTLSGYGTLTYDEKEDLYRYDSTVQQSTPRVFEHGIMLPGDVRRVELSVRLVEERHVLIMRYNMMPMEQLRRIAFLPVEGRERTTRYMHLQNLPEDYLKGVPSPVGPIHERPAILWEALSPQPLLLLEQKATRRVPLKPVSVALSKAREQAGFSSGHATWWSWAEGWVLNGPDQAVLVTAQGKRPLPLVDPQLFRDFDSGKSRIRVKLTAGAQVFRGRFASREGDGIYTFGEFIDVPRDRLWEFFDLARIEHLAIGRETYLFDAYFYTLTPTP